MDKETKTENKIVQTYAEDMAQVIESDTEGLVKKIIHGEEEHEAEKRNLSPESKQNKTFMLVGIMLLFLGAITLSFFFFNKPDNTVTVQNQFTPLIFTDQSTYLEVAGLNKDQITQTVLHQINTTRVKSGGLEEIYLTLNKQIIGLRRFISLTQSNFLPDANPILVSDNFLLGDVNTGADSSLANVSGFFILLKVRSTADIFDSLRAWERKMFADLYKFLGINVSIDTNYLFSKNFEDGIIENKNARVLIDKEGNIVLMYIFADDNSVIITNSPSAAREIILRLASSQKKQ